MHPSFAKCSGKGAGDRREILPEPFPFRLDRRPRRGRPARGPEGRAAEAQLPTGVPRRPHMPTVPGGDPQVTQGCVHPLL